MDQLNFCPFCGNIMDVNFPRLSCSKVRTHSANQLYYTLFNNLKARSALIIYGKYRIEIHYDIGKTFLLNSFTFEQIMSLDYILDFEISEKNIKNKIKTLLTFS